MRSEYESRISYVYGLLLITILTIVVIFLLCDFNILPKSWCQTINNLVEFLTEKINL